MSAVKDLDFLRKIQRLLAEGEFTSTYKFALLQALADLSVERSVNCVQDTGLIIPVVDIANKFIEYYWRQAVPYAPNPDQPGVLNQNAHRQAAVINSIIEIRSQVSGSLSTAKNNTPAWNQLVRNVVRLVKTMPLWKLQVINRSVDDFIYKQNHLENGCIQLRPGVHSTFRLFHGLITKLIHSGWLSQIRHISKNREVLGERGDLAEFMFGAERKNLDGYRNVLRDHQLGKCFYCNKSVHSEGCADHFIPWSRYPVDLGHNFVFTHESCNNNKRDYLAHPDHLAHWRECNLEAGIVLDEAFDAKGLAHDVNRSRLIAIWAYEQGEKSMALTWLRKERYILLDDQWFTAIGGLRAVAEDFTKYSDN